MIECSNPYISATVWASQLCYLVAFIPQIFLNYRRKSLSGLSDLYILAFFNGYLAEGFYVFCLGFPSAYRIVNPLCVIGVTALVYQRFKYADRPNKRLGYFVGINVLFMALLVPFAFCAALQIGHIAGWITTVIWTIYQVPQVMKNFSQKSTQGFSLMLSSFIAVAALLELVSALALGLPMQTVVTTSRSLLIYAIFLIQFMVYK